MLLVHTLRLMNYAALDIPPYAVLAFLMMIAFLIQS
jgi:hypothetical protein